MTHFWSTGPYGVVENTLIRYYIDGEKIPSVAFLPPLVKQKEAQLNHFQACGVGFNDQQVHKVTSLIYISVQNSLIYEWRHEFHICWFGCRIHGATNGLGREHKMVTLPSHYSVLFSLTRTFSYTLISHICIDYIVSGAWFNNFRIPFGSSIKVTAQSLNGTKGGFYIILRGRTSKSHSEWRS